MVAGLRSTTACYEPESRTTVSSRAEVEDGGMLQARVDDGGEL
jgi:hypothetical protein